MLYRPINLIVKILIAIVVCYYIQLWLISTLESGFKWLAETLG